MNELPEVIIGVAQGIGLAESNILEEEFAKDGVAKEFPALREGVPIAKHFEEGKMGRFEEGYHCRQPDIFSDFYLPNGVLRGEKLTWMDLQTQSHLASYPFQQDLAKVGRQGSFRDEMFHGLTVPEDSWMVVS